MRVDVSGHVFVFPYECACCSSPPDCELTISSTRSWGKRVRHFETKAWQIPYCSNCLRHIRSMQAAGAFARLFTCLSILLGVIVGFGVDGILGAGMGILSVTATVVVFSTKLRGARAECSPNCAKAEAAIDYLGWSGTLHQFEVSSQRFAFDFMTANQRKLVNLSPAARSLLLPTGPLVTQGISRSPHRYKN